MSLPTSGLPTSSPPGITTMFTQAASQRMQSMNLRGIPPSVVHSHQFGLAAQPNMLNLPGHNMMLPVPSSDHQGLASMPATDWPNNSPLNGHSSTQQQAPDSSSGSQGISNRPFDNITVKQEAGIPPQSAPAPLQFPQLSSTNNSAPNPFSITNTPSVSKHICAVCGDRASGKHYGVYSCEGCKGFFKRTVRKMLTYTCRDDKDCVIDKRQRNRCQYCRYQKCQAMGMKKEAVQEERQKSKDQDDMSCDPANPSDDMPVDRILQAELASDPKPEEMMNLQESMVSESSVCKAADHQLITLVDWAKRVPHFSSLPLDDQVTLLRAGWNELLIASFSHRSIGIPDGIILSSGLHVYRQTAQSAGVGAIFDRVLTELIAKMRDMNMDRTELGCLRTIVLFNPDAKDLSDSAHIEQLREKVYASLEVYCKTKYPDQPGRFAKLLLRLPALRSIGLKCLEHLFFFKLIDNTPIDQFLLDKLSNDDVPIMNSSLGSSGPSQHMVSSTSANDFASTSAVSSL